VGNCVPPSFLFGLIPQVHAGILKQLLLFTKKNQKSIEQVAF
jgi:hypothetical protein